MKKYYLFVIKNDYYKIYRKTPLMLYRTLENLYMLEKYNFPYGISIYQQICQPFSVKLLTNYILNKYKCYKKNKIIKIDSFIEKTILQLGYSTSVIITNKEIPEIMKLFNIYNRKIFVCEFNNKEYFWLNNKLNKKVKNIK